MKLDLNDVAIFVKLGQYRSLTKTAHALEQPKSRISRRLVSLEKALGAQLVHRTTRQFVLTEIGEKYLEQCRQHIQALENQSLELPLSNTHIAGSLRLTAPEDIGSEVLPPLLDEFTKKYPQLEVSLVLTNQIVEIVRDRFDLALRVGRQAASTLRSRKLGTVSMICVASPTYLRMNMPTGINDLTSHRLLVFTGDDHGRSVTLVNGKLKHKIPKPYSFVTNHSKTARDMAIRSNGIAIVPEFLCRPHLQRGELVEIVKPWRSDPLPISLTYAPQVELPARLRLLIDFLTPRLTQYFSLADGSS